MSMSLKQAVATLQAAGLPVPEELSHYFKLQDRVDRGVVQVWRCYSTKCKKEHETFVPVIELCCGCGHLCRRVWPK
jgi:hypothetical protein